MNREEERYFAVGLFLLLSLGVTMLLDVPILVLLIGITFGVWLFGLAFGLAYIVAEKGDGYGEHRN